MNTEWKGLWKQDRQGFYAGQVIRKKDIPSYTRIVLRYNKFYDKEKNRPKFVYCFADSDGYKEKCIPLEIEETEEVERLYTAEEVMQVIHGMELEYGLEYGNNLIEDYIY